MGQITLVWFGGLALLGLALTAAGLLARLAFLRWAGISLLVSLAGAWILGPMGLLLGVLMLGGWWIRRKKPGA